MGAFEILRGRTPPRWNQAVFLDVVGGADLGIRPAMSTSIICERSFEFSVRILNLCARLWSRGPIPRHIASQLIKCGTSIGSNAEEAQEGQSKPDYIAKMSISRKESRETTYWLRLAIRAEAVTSGEVDWELNEAQELRRMIISAIMTAQSSQSRG